MLTIDYFINGNTVDNDALVHQWQLCQEAMGTHMWLESLDCLPSIFKVAQADGMLDKVGERLQRRLNVMGDLIDEWNKSTKIIEDQGDKLRHAVRVAQNLHEAGLGEFTAIVLEELPF